MIVEGIEKCVHITNHFPVSCILLCITMQLLTSNKFVYIAGKEEMNNIEFYF